MKVLPRILAILLTAFIVTNCATEIDSVQPLEVAAKKAKSSNASSPAAQSTTTTIQDCMDFESYNAGDTPGVVATAICDVLITGDLPSEPGIDRAMIFDADNFTGGDDDLAVADQHKILILSEDGDASDPDDANEEGAQLTFDFSDCGVVTIESMVVIDVEEAQGETKDAKIVLYDAADQFLSEVDIPNIGNGLKATLPVNQAGVAKMVVILDGSGAIDDICFSKEIPGGGSSCTRTIGYWKGRTGTGNGNQADEVTPLLPLWLGTNGGAKSIQVTTNVQAKDLLDQKNCGNNASNGIGKLHSQLLGAKLNIAAGTDATDAAAAIAAADAFLANHECSDWAGLSASDQADVLSWHSTLDQYNNGAIGPGHCN